VFVSQQPLVVVMFNKNYVKVIFDLLLYYKRVLEILGSSNAVVRHRVSESRSIIGALGDLRSCLKTF
jgi:hypothetical protein